MEIKIDWTQEKKDKVADIVEAWIREHDAVGGEMIAQDDECELTACGVLATIVDDAVKPEFRDDAGDEWETW